jgi:hypothetical protein
MFSGNPVLVVVRFFLLGGLEVAVACAELAFARPL